VAGVLDEALSQKGPFLLEIDMLAIGSFKTVFAGPPVNETAKAAAAAAVVAAVATAATA
jgi:acetolactate synthase-1/2/3 large subunit